MKVSIDKASLAKLTEYENYREGRSTKDCYLKENEKYAAVISKYAQQINELESKIREIEQECGQENMFVERFKRHINIQNLTRAIVDELINVVYIYDSTRIEIIWNFADEYATLIQALQER